MQYFLSSFAFTKANYSAFARQNDGPALALREEVSFCLDFLMKKIPHN